MKVLSTILLCTIAMFCLACGGGTSTGANGSLASGANTNSAKTNVEELAMSVNVPYQVDDLVWKEFPGQKRIVAVMRVDPADSAKIIADATSQGQPENVSVPSQKWFPAELVAQAEMSGDNTLRGQAYTANAFYQEPYTSGRITRIEGTDYFVLDLTAK